ncbi:hypothetical protein [Xenorhabdus sp. SGI246]|uniref:hypothetical protein n=1 Tax=Xenorhabdus sp. SGI246 TaxID=3158263 RepID=UPI00349F9487
MYDNNLLLAPIINGYDGHYLYNGNNSYFCVIIPAYEYAHDTDTICFYVNGHSTGDCFVLGDVTLLDTRCTKRLSFTIFEIGNTCEFSYSVTRNDGSMQNSESLSVFYSGQTGPYQNAEYDPCLVYSSFGIDHANIIHQHDNDDCSNVNVNNVVNCYTLSNYQNTQDGQTGLYVVIQGSNDTPGGVRMGSAVSLNASVDFCLRLDTTLGPKIMEPYPHDPNIGRVVFCLDYRELEGFCRNWYCKTSDGQSFGYSKLTFTYSTEDGRTSSPWSGRIFTCGPGYTSPPFEAGKPECPDITFGPNHGHINCPRCF